MTPLRLLVLTLCALAFGPAHAATPAKVLAGVYDGGQTEMAAGLELMADGRFRYGLSYGALDEQAEGRWTLDGERVLLTSAPVKAPKFVLVSAKPAAGDTLKVTLDLPKGMNRQYFNARLTLADGRTVGEQFGADGLEIPLPPGERVTAVAVTLPILGLAGEAAPLSGGRGGGAHFRFEPNDIGKVGFDRQPLRIEAGGLRLERHERSILFRKVEKPVR